MRPQPRPKELPVVLTWRGLHDKRWYQHPTCGRWSVPIDEPVPDRIPCANCGKVFPVREDNR